MKTMIMFACTGFVRHIAAFAGIPGADITPRAKLQVQLSQQLNGATTVAMPETVLRYDFNLQYPFYEVKPGTWRAMDSIQIKLSSLPQKGYIYIFSTGNNNETRVIDGIDCAKVAAADTSFYAPGIDSNGGSICVWYAADTPLTSFPTLIAGLELTNGPYLQRVLHQAGRHLYLPSEDWNFTEPAMGIQLAENRIWMPPASAIIPLVIIFTGQGEKLTFNRKMTRKHSKKTTQ